MKTFTQSKQKKLRPTVYLAAGVAVVILIVLATTVWQFASRAFAGNSLGIESMGNSKASAPAVPTVAATPTAAHTSSASPALRQVTDPITGKQYLMAPDDVVNKIKSDYGERLQSGGTLKSAKDALSETSLARYFMGEALQSQRAAAKDLADGKLTEISIAKGVNRILEVKDFSQDGMEATLGETQVGGTFEVYDFKTGKLLRSEPAGGLILWRVRYDPTDNRWKAAKFLDYVVPPKQ